MQAFEIVGSDDLVRDDQHLMCRNAPGYELTMLEQALADMNRVTALTELDDNCFHALKGRRSGSGLQRCEMTVQQLAIDDRDDEADALAARVDFDVGKLPVQRLAVFAQLLENGTAITGHQ